MSLGLLNAAMIAGLAGAAIPVVIHLLSRRRDVVIDWGAMQFLDLGRRARRKVQIEDLLLMLARMAVLALAALALARPYWQPRAGADGPGPAVGGGASGERRDVVLILDGSDSMAGRAGATTPRAEAVRWARGFLDRLGPGDSVAVLDAGARARPLVDPPSFDLAAVAAALDDAPAPAGPSDLPSALAEAFRILERANNPARDVVILSDGQRFAWRPGETRRWDLVRELHRRLPVAPRVWALDFSGEPGGDAEPNGALGPLELSRAVLTPGLPVAASAELTNLGPGPLTTRAELLVDGRAEAGSAQAVGPVPEGGKTRLTFRASIAEPGDHLVAIRLAPGADPRPGDDTAAHPARVIEALPVLLLDGEPSPEPLGGEVDFLRAALAPTGDETPQVRASVVSVDAFTPSDLDGKAMAVLANAARPDPVLVAALGRFVEEGGGLLIAPGDRVDADWYGTRLGPEGAGWLPARIGELRGDFARRGAVARPDPGTFLGPALGPLGRGEAPALGSAALFAYRVLEPLPGATVAARLDSGDPWVVERPAGLGRVAILAGPLDAEGGTLPANPDFVPLVHEWAFDLGSAASAPRAIGPGDPPALDLDPPPGPEVSSLPLTRPDGSTAPADVTRRGRSAQVVLDPPGTPGTYKVNLPDGRLAYAVIEPDPRESDPAPLDPAEAAALAEGWPLAFEPDPDRLAPRLLDAGGTGRRELWRGLVVAALGGLCLEVWMTRRLARTRGLAAD